MATLTEHAEHEAWLAGTLETYDPRVVPECGEQTCSLCDALGHGYPGAGPCPLEERGAYEPEERW